MEKQSILLGICSLLAINLIGQSDGLPSKPEPGKCYVRTVTAMQFDTLEKRVMIRPAYTTFQKLPAEYRTVEERIVIKPATKRYVPYPAEFKTVTDTMLIEEGPAEITVNAPKFKSMTEDIEVRPKTTGLEWKTSLEDCESKDPRDCMVLQYVEHPAEFKRVDVQVMDQTANYTIAPKKGKFTTIKRQVVVKEAGCDVVEVPAEFATVTKQVLVKDEELVKVEVPNEYIIEPVLVLKDPGGVEKWEEIDCALTDNNLLPISFESGNARLSIEARSIVDAKLLKLMKDKPNIRVEIAAHTDSRGAADANQSLSQARAESVLNYLVGRGIQRSRLVAKGYGESKLKNRCADGVECAEGEHAANRRTEFRVLSN
jgi:OOP family OmpA-OmpF porin